MTKSNSKNEFFRINVRPDKKPYIAEQGKVVGDQIVGTSWEVSIEPPSQWIPNYYEANVIKKMDARGVYNGEFEWYDENKHEGKSPELIQVRYLASCSSLDAKFQNERGFVPKGEEEEVGWQFPSGKVSDIPKSKATPRFVEFFEHHALHGNNPHRDKNDLPAFFIVDSARNVSNKRDLIAKEAEMTNYKNRILKDDERVECLAVVFGVNAGYSIDDKRDALIDKVMDDASAFIEHEKGYIKKTEEALSALFAKKVLTLDGGKVFEGNTERMSSVKVESGDNVKTIASKIALLATTSPDVNKQVTDLLINIKK